MRKILGLVILGLCISSPAKSAELHAELLGFAQCHADVKEMDFRAKPSMCSNISGVNMAFIVKGENLIGIDKDSVSISSLTLSGQDILAANASDSAYEFGFFPHIDDEGKMIVFDMEVMNVPFGRLNDLSMTGNVNAFVSEQQLTETVSVNLSEAFEGDLGPYKYTNKRSFGGKITDGIVDGMMGDKDGEKTRIQIKGDLSALKDVVLMIGGEEIESRGASWSGDIKTFRFETPPSGQADIVLKYWDNLQVVPIKILYGKTQ